MSDRKLKPPPLDLFRHQDSAIARAAKAPRTSDLLALRDLEEVQGSTEFRCDLIEFCRGDPEVPMGLLKASASPAATLRFVIELETAWAMVTSLLMGEARSVESMPSVQD